MNEPAPFVELNDGRRLPQLGFGTYQIESDDAARSAVERALETGYRLVDTAAVYGNESGVGQGLKSRDKIWLTTKIWNDRQGRDEARRAFDESLQRLGRENVDLLLIHWPCPDKGQYVETWKAFVQLREEGRARSIGVSNFCADHLDAIVQATGVTPAINQIELHPSFQQRELRAVHARMGIVTQSWSPLGQGKGLDDPTVKDVADRVGRSAAQVILRWHLQHGLAAIPKASSLKHMRDNYGALEFELSHEDMKQLDALDDDDGRIGPNPRTFC